jgi:hypothetical protein
MLLLAGAKACHPASYLAVTKLPRMLQAALNAATYRFSLHHNGHEAEQRKACCSEASIHREGGNLHVQRSGEYGLLEC